LQSGKTRNAIDSLLTAFRNTPQDDTNRTVLVLRTLAKAYADIGRLKDAKECKERIAMLKGDSLQGDESSAKAAEKVELPAALKKSLEQALEAGIAGHFGALRALLYAFRDGRGDITLAALLSYQHPTTQATPMMVAAAKGELDLLRAMLLAKVPLDALSSNGTNVLTWACKFNQPECVKELLQHGAQFDGSFSGDTLQSYSPAVQSAIAEYIASKKLENATLEEQVQQDPNWDQFKENARLFGTSENSTFDESQYTTKLDMSKISDEDRKKAEELAKQIAKENKDKKEKQKAGAELEYTEEEEHSAVLRPSEAATGEIDTFTDQGVLAKSKAATNTTGSKKKKANKPAKKK